MNTLMAKFILMVTLTNNTMDITTDYPRAVVFEHPYTVANTPIMTDWEKMKLIEGTAKLYSMYEVE